MFSQFGTFPTKYRRIPERTLEPPMTKILYTLTTIFGRNEPTTFQRSLALHMVAASSRGALS